MVKVSRLHRAHKEFRRDVATDGITRSQVLTQVITSLESTLEVLITRPRTSSIGLTVQKLLAGTQEKFEKDLREFQRDDATEFEHY